MNVLLRRQCTFLASAVCDEPNLPNDDAMLSAHTLRLCRPFAEDASQRVGLKFFSHGSLGHLKFLAKAFEAITSVRVQNDVVPRYDRTKPNTDFLQFSCPAMWMGDASCHRRLLEKMQQNGVTEFASQLTLPTLDMCSMQNLLAQAVAVHLYYRLYSVSREGSAERKFASSALKKWFGTNPSVPLLNTCFGCICHSFEGSTPNDDDACTFPSHMQNSANLLLYVISYQTLLLHEASTPLATNTFPRAPLKPDEV